MKTLYNTQELLFKRTSKIVTKNYPVQGFLTDFESKGYTILSGISSPEEAQGKAESFIQNVNGEKFSVHKQFRERVQLAKADAIPVCHDSVETSFQGLHFDMGQPFSGGNQFFVSIVVLYKPLNTPRGNARTRVLPLKNLLSDARWGTEEQIEEKILHYVKKHGDGWTNVNTQRLTCFARLVDAISGGEALKHYKGKTMAEWFSKSSQEPGEIKMKREHDFYAKRGLDVKNKAIEVTLQPGEMIIIDNTRVSHGRIGKRKEKEIYQFMYGVSDAKEEEIDTFRKELIRLMKVIEI